MYSLAAQVVRIEKEGIEGRWARHLDMATRTWRWAEEMRGRGTQIGVLVPEGSRSPTVTCLTVPAGKKGSEINEAMKARGFTISAGYGSLKDSTIRIGHMGDHTVAELDLLLAALEEVLAA
jgi:aspartate aminotransferase-like enzyme